MMPVAVAHVTVRVVVPVPHNAEQSVHGPVVHTCRCCVDGDGDIDKDTVAVVVAP